MRTMYKELRIDSIYQGPHLTSCIQEVGSNFLVKSDSLWNFSKISRLRECPKQIQTVEGVSWSSSEQEGAGLARSWSLNEKVEARRPWITDPVYIPILYPPIHGTLWFNSRDIVVVTTALQTLPSFSNRTGHFLNISEMNKCSLHY